jgi:DNA-binding response OmpR family regulator
MPPARILAIDDDPLIGMSLAAILSAYDLTVAESGEDGLARFEASRFDMPFDLVICDLMLPGIDGMEVIHRIRALRPEQRVMVLSADGRPERLIGGLREKVVDFVVKPVGSTDLQTAVANILEASLSIEVLSAAPHWIELLIPASFQVAASLTHFFANFQSELDDATRTSVSLAFRELINNAIEHGARGDASQKIRVSCARMRRAIIYRIDDPGPGFDVAALPHAAISYPDDPIKHMEVRHEQGLRAGGYGMLWTQSLADEVIYNEQRNKVMFIKYL